jgi:pyridoxine 5-phosphate synthase
VRNVGALARISEVSEFNIGHHIVSRAVFVGLAESVKSMKAAIELQDN